MSIIYSWSTNTNTWVNSSKEEHSYDSNGNQTLSIYYTWNTSTSAWKNSSKYESSYDSNGNQTLQLGYYWNTNTNTWGIGSKYESFYDSNGNQASTNYYKWNTIINTWLSSSKSEYSYDTNGNKILYSEHIWNTSTNTWVGSYKYEYSYDANGNQLLYSLYIWNTNANTWRGSSKSTSTFNLNYTFADLILHSEPYSTNMLTVRTNYSWDDTSNTWGQGVPSIYYYSPQEVTSVREQQNNTAKLYPNPATEFFNVTLLDNAGKATIELYDVQGRKVLAQTIEDNGQVAVNELKAGLYMYRISTDKGKTQSGKFVKE